MPTAARTKRAAEGEQGRTNTNQEEEMDWAKQEGSKHERGIQDCPNAGSAPSRRHLHIKAGNLAIFSLSEIFLQHYDCF